MVYQGMDIGTAKPSLAERQQVRHYLIDLLHPDQPFSVWDYVREAEAAIATILEQNQIPLVVGGSGYYIRALSEGLHPLPPPDLELQTQLWEVIATRGPGSLLAELEAASPEDAVRVQRNPRRLVRAVEVLRRTGVPPAKIPRRAPRFRYQKLILWPPWEWLEPRLKARVEQMFEQGLVQEVEGLLVRYPQMPTALQSIGYKEVAGFLQGKYTLEEAQEAVVLATRAYAKRQYTWFRKEPGRVSFLPFGADAAWAGVQSWFESSIQGF
jgi:tRNA dimethylallyltransferase